MQPEDIIGRTITAVRYMTQDELDDLDWRGPVPILILDDGTEILAARDDEGNDAGRLWIDNPTVSN